jgi:hypothetical protein
MNPLHLEPRTNGEMLGVPLLISIGPGRWLRTPKKMVPFSCIAVFPSTSTTSLLRYVCEDCDFPLLLCTTNTYSPLPDPEAFVDIMIFLHWNQEMVVGC